MQKFSQKDKRWGSLKINKTNSTMSSWGCFIVSLSMLADITPDECLEKLEKGGGLYNDLVIPIKACKILGLDYVLSDNLLKSPQPMALSCIAEVDFSPREGKQTHFVVYLGKGKIIDSFDGEEKNNPYEISNYRNIFPKGAYEREEDRDRKIKELEQTIDLIGNNYERSLQKANEEVEKTKLEKEKIEEELKEEKKTDYICPKKAGAKIGIHFLIAELVLILIQKFTGQETDSELKNIVFAGCYGLAREAEWLLNYLYSKYKKT